MEIAQGEVRAVRWMLEDFPLEGPQRRCDLIGTMRTGVVMQQQRPFSEEAWSLPANGATKFFFFRIMQYEADVMVWSRCWNSVTTMAWQSQNTVNMTFLADGVTLMTFAGTGSVPGDLCLFYIFSSHINL